MADRNWFPNNPGHRMTNYPAGVSDYSQQTMARNESISNPSSQARHRSSNEDSDEATLTSFATNRNIYRSQDQVSSATNDNSHASLLPLNPFSRQTSRFNKSSTTAAQDTPVSPDLVDYMDDIKELIIFYQREDIDCVDQYTGDIPDRIELQDSDSEVTMHLCSPSRVNLQESKINPYTNAGSTVFTETGELRESWKREIEHTRKLYFGCEANFDIEEDVIGDESVVIISDSETVTNNESTTGSDVIIYSDHET